MSDKYGELLASVQELSLAITSEEFRSLNNPARVAIIRLCLVAGTTNTSWWTEWLEYCCIIANITAKKDGMFE